MPGDPNQIDPDEAAEHAAALALGIDPADVNAADLGALIRETAAKGRHASDPEYLDDQGGEVDARAEVARLTELAEQARLVDSGGATVMVPVGDPDPEIPEAALRAAEEMLAEAQALKAADQAHRPEEPAPRVATQPEVPRTAMHLGGTVSTVVFTTKIQTGPNRALDFTLAYCPLPDQGAGAQLLLDAGTVAKAIHDLVDRSADGDGRPEWYASWLASWVASTNPAWVEVSVSIDGPVTHTAVSRIGEVT